MGKRNHPDLGGMGAVQLHFDLLIELLLIFRDPVGECLLDNRPASCFLMHIKDDTIAPIIDGVYRKYLFLQLTQFAEIEFAQPATGFNQSGKVHHFGKMYLHKTHLKILTCNYCAILCR